MSASAETWTRRLAADLGYEQAGCWRCGALSELLARILDLSGMSPVVLRGMANGVGHVWVTVDGVIYDPTAGQFAAPITYVADAGLVP